MARELEMKYRSDKAHMAAIRKDFPDLTPIRMETTYFDTPDRLLGQLRQTLRCRLENDTAVYALKTYLPDGSHGEWETRAGSLEEALTFFRNSDAPRLPRLTELTPICGARFTRSCVTLPIPGGTAELALDEGVLLGNGKELPLCEVELELKEGTDEALFAFCKAFSEKYALEEELLSKFARARKL